MRTQSFGASRFVVLRLDPGEDVLLSIRAAVNEQEIRNAAILSGVGSLDRYHFPVVKTTNMPPGNTFVQGEGPFDILTVTGLVVDSEVHDANGANEDHAWRGAGWSSVRDHFLQAGEGGAQESGGIDVERVPVRQS